jgi:hypothetical protein
MCLPKVGTGLYTMIRTSHQVVDTPEIGKGISNVSFSEDGIIAPDSLIDM